MSKTLLPFFVGDVSAFTRSLRRGLEGLDRAPSHVEMLNLVAKAGGYRNFQHFKAASVSPATQQETFQEAGRDTVRPAAAPQSERGGAPVGPHIDVPAGRQGDSEKEARYPRGLELLQATKKGKFQETRRNVSTKIPSGNNVSPQAPAVAVNAKRVKKTARFFDEQRRLIRWPGKHSQRMLCLWALWARIPAGVGMSEREISDRLEKQHLFGDYALLRRELVDRGMVERTPDGRRYERVEQRPPQEAVALLERLRP